MVLVPSDSAGDEFRHLVRQTLANAELTPGPKGDDIIIYRERFRLGWADLPRVAYHARFFYNDTAATENSGIIWTQETLSSYLKQPKHDVPGTNMTFPGLQSQTDIDNVIAYIGQFSRDGGKN
ncbi:MAG: hypothetical protein JO223_23055 [Hyphomicrobiales bacterium]|nr:hypothetical protein [Hyphomicrobiales bacterium]